LILGAVAPGGIGVPLSGELVWSWVLIGVWWMDLELIFLLIAGTFSARVWLLNWDIWVIWKWIELI
jgi:hypothetical protein